MNYKTVRQRRGPHLPNAAVTWHCMFCAEYKKKKGGNRVAGRVVSINVGTQRTKEVLLVDILLKAGSIPCSIGSCHWAYGGCVVHLFRYHRCTFDRD